MISVPPLVWLGLYSLRALFYVAIVLSVVISLVYFTLHERWARERRRLRIARIQSRDAIPVERQVEPLCTDHDVPMNDAREVWQGVAAFLKIDPERMRPTDSMAEDYAPAVEWRGYEMEPSDWDLEDMILDLYRRRRERGWSISDIAPKTLEEYIVAACREHP